MPSLTPPDVRYHESFLEAVAEFADEGGEGQRFAGLGVLAAVGSFPGEVFTADELQQESTFSAYVERLLEVSRPQTPLPPEIVSSTTLWWVDGDEYLGRLSIRHRLTRWLLDFGGHIGYAVRPSARGCGHAKAMLAASLPWAAELGLDAVLVTCDDTNIASRRTIEGVGGVFEDQRGEKLRYWLPTPRRSTLSWEGGFKPGIAQRETAGRQRPVRGPRLVSEEYARNKEPALLTRSDRTLDG